MTGATVLLADDMTIVRRPLALFLARRGFRVIEVQDGQEVLDLLAREHVDALVLDLSMPTVDGFGVLEALQRRGALPPTIVMTSHAVREWIERAYGLGASEVLIKAAQPLAEVALRVQALIDAR